jgi:hypothetical protein
MGNGFFGDMLKFCGVTIPNEATRCEVWSSSFKDEGSDFNEFRFFNDDKLIKTNRVNGY